MRKFKLGVLVTMILSINNLFGFNQIYTNEFKSYLNQELGNDFNDGWELVKEFQGVRIESKKVDVNHITEILFSTM